MRVYKKDITATNLKPLIALHGGSWKFRGFGYVGLESQLSHFTDEGFIVFMPSYRLTGDAETDWCGGVKGADITKDALFALDWVKKNGPLYGAANEKISVFGQSAGGHLATAIALNRPNDVKNGLVLYPPTDASDYMRTLQNGSAVNPLGVEALQSFLGVDLYDHLVFTQPAVVSNSFPAIVAANPKSFPPLFMIHGRSDTLVPSSQSVRLCNAYAGVSDLNFGPAANDGGVIVKDYQCGSSQLHMIAQGEHVLDFCLPGVLCPAGDQESQKAVRKSLSQGRQWLSGRVDSLIWPIINFILE